MPITLAGVQANLANDIDYATIDELRMGSPYLLDRLQFVDTVIPGEAGGTLTAGYNRISMTRPAHTRQENTEYPAFEATKRRVTVDLVPVGARYNIDRVHAKIGAASEVAFQQGQAVRATIAKFSDLFINGAAGSTFASATPEFEGLDSIVSGTITESFQTGSTPWAFSAINSQATAQTASRALRAWLRVMEGEPDVFFVNKDGAAFLDTVNDFLSQATTTADQFGRDVPTYRAVPYVLLGNKPGAVDENLILTGAQAESEIIGTDGNGVTTIYAVQFGVDAVHGYSTPGQLFSQWLPDFSSAGAVKPGEVEIGPVALAVKRVRSAGAFRVDVA